MAIFYQRLLCVRAAMAKFYQWLLDVRADISWLAWTSLGATQSCIWWKGRSQLIKNSDHMNQLCSLPQAMPWPAATHSDYCVYWNKEQFIVEVQPLFVVILASLAVSSDIRWHQPRVQLVTSQTLWTEGKEIRKEMKHFQGGKLLEFLSGNCQCVLQHKRGSWELRVSLSSTCLPLPAAASGILVKNGFLGENL